MESYKETFLKYTAALQDEICSRLEAVDGKAVFGRDEWQRTGGGGGLSRVISKGEVFEKGGVNTSAVHGQLPAAMQEVLKTRHDRFFACGLSLVLHPLNPYVPTVHANYRYFELYDAKGEVVDQWFGGGSDLTPYYYYEADVRHFHAVQQRVCDGMDKTLYPRFKAACDAYFFNPHRNEARGVGGLFFDYLRPDGEHDSRFWLEMTMALGRAFLPAYLPIVERRRGMEYGERQRYWQEIRRGRYVEFNLLHDRGTLFGIKTQGRTESILMSLPPRVRWEYDYRPESGSPEEELLRVLGRAE